MATQRKQYTIHRCHISVVQEYADGSTATVMDSDHLTVVDPQPCTEETAHDLGPDPAHHPRRCVKSTRTVEPRGIAAVVEIESRRGGRIGPWLEGGYPLNMGVDFEGPFGPGEIRRTSAEGALESARAGRPGYRLIRDDMAAHEG
jgi:hypothetical protein